MSTDYEMITFETSTDWREWLSMHHADTNGIILQLYKKASGIASVSYAEALDHALCYGWIDGQRNAYDELSYTQKFTPRRKASLWSKRNIEYIARLTDAGLMTPAGQSEIDRAIADGRWDAAYDKPSQMTIPNYFLAELDKNPKAKEYFATLNKSNRYAVGWRLQTAKTDETRQRRTAKMIAMLETNTFV